jgi:FKBP12-rapamycin complex-associated protein
MGGRDDQAIRESLCQLSLSHGNAISQAPETPDEDQFVQQYGKALQGIYKTLVKYRNTKQLSLVNTAYGELYNASTTPNPYERPLILSQLFGEIEAQLNQWRVPGSKLHLATSAPKLLSLRDCILTVPGIYPLPVL